MEDLIARSYRPAFTLAVRLLGNRDDAAEATQEAYIRMVRSLKGFREVGAFPTWLFRIVTNVCLTELRRRRTRRETPMDVEAGADVQPVDAEEVAVERAFRTEIESCMARLPEAYRTVIVLRDVYDMAGDEVAKSLGISEGAVKVRLHRARRRLRDEMVAKYPDWAAEEKGRRESA
jgi:RNA polymerase sigma-70 factor (ECF subfamily)